GQMKHRTLPGTAPPPDSTQSLGLEIDSLFQEVNIEIETDYNQNLTETFTLLGFTKAYDDVLATCHSAWKGNDK
ncbi:MAG: hypothetical protein OXQ94_12970, partial [Gemmatimonadota bacterium]|nr:hypothetical protein [Gemmatimonadota bacterium]